jgi:hypothetical protein
VAVKPVAAVDTVAVAVATDVVTAAVTGSPDPVLTDPETCGCCAAGAGVVAAVGPPTDSWLGAAAMLSLSTGAEPAVSLVRATR